MTEKMVVLNPPTTTQNLYVDTSVAILGDLLQFGQLFKVWGNIFLVESFLGNFYGHLATFYWSHWLRPRIT